MRCMLATGCGSWCWRPTPSGTRASKREIANIPLWRKRGDYFFCQVKHSAKLASLCASNTAPASHGNVYYVFGIQAKVELHYPDRPVPPREVFQRTHLVYAGPTGAYAYSFSRAGVEYVLYSISGADHFEKQGLLAYRPGEHKPLADLECKEGTVIETENPELSDFTMTWPENSELAAHGLPF